MMNRTAKLGCVAATLFLALGLGGPGSALAGHTDGTVEVKAKVSAACSINSATIDFGTYDPVNLHPLGTPNDQQADITVRCTKGATGIQVDLDRGSNADGNQRRMQNGSDATAFLSYEIYKDTGRTNVLGSAIPGGSKTDAPAGTGGDVTVRLYGRIAGGQLSATQGSYVDSMVSTVNF